ERLNATDDRRHRLQQRLARLRARQRAAQRELDTAQQRLDEQVRATYMEGPQWLLGELVGGTSPPDVLRRIPMQKAALEARAGGVTDVRARKGEGDGPKRAAGPRRAGGSGRAEGDSPNERVAPDLAEADLVHRRQAEERRQVQRLVSQLQATLDRIDKQLAGYLEAEDARSEAARRGAACGSRSLGGCVA